MEKAPSTGVLLINMGGPTSLDEVEPFLYNLFSDPDIMGINRFILKPLARIIAKRRAPVAKDFYKKIGGKSPLVHITMRQGEALEKALASYASFMVFVAMRYSHPLIKDVVPEMLTIPFRKIIVLPLYPQYSITTTGSCINEFNRVWDKVGSSKVEVHRVTEWYENPLYIDAICETINTTAEKHNLNRKDVHILFSAHGIPVKFIRQGDPYIREIEKTVDLVMSRLGWGIPHIGYQSRVGPYKWVGPSVEEMLQKLGEENVKTLIVVPISFVSDHIETLYEIDVYLKEKARSYGILHFYRAPSLNTSPVFIEALKNIVIEAYLSVYQTTYMRT